MQLNLNCCLLVECLNGKERFYKRARWVLEETTTDCRHQHWSSVTESNAGDNNSHAWLHWLQISMQVFFFFFLRKSRCRSIYGHYSMAVIDATLSLVWFIRNVFFPSPLCGSCIHAVIDACRGGGGFLICIVPFLSWGGDGPPCRAVCQPISCLLAYLKRCITAEVCLVTACVADMPP